MIFIFDESEPNRFMEKYFEGVKLIKKIDIMRSFHRKVWGENDPDGLKFAILYFIHSVSLSGERATKKVPRLYFDLVESGRYNQFLLAKKAFYLLMKSLSKKLNSEKQFYRIGGMPIVFQIWLFECSSSIDFQTTNESHRYKKLMNTIFSDVNNKIKFRNIPPNQRKLAVLQLQPEGINNQAPPQYSDSSDDDLDDQIIDSNDDPREGSCDDIDSDDNFQAPPPQAVKVKRKGKVGSSTSPVRKRTKKLVTGGSKQVAKNLEPRISVKQPMKKNVISKKVKQEFVKIRNLIKDNFKTVLTTINSTRDEQEHSDDHIVPPYSNDEDGYTPPYTSNKESPSNQVLVVQCDKLESGKSEVNQPSFVFDIPPKKVLGVSENSHEVDVEQMPCPLPIRILDHMNVTTDSQFELDDQFMPSLNFIKSSIAPHSTDALQQRQIRPLSMSIWGTNGEKLMIDQPISNNEQTPLPTSRNRRPGPYNTSPYLTNFGSSTGSSSSQPHFFELKHPFIFDLISGDYDITLWDAFRSWIRDRLLTKHDKK
uniref:DUF1985 domain-containing protein n=1 Tax=Solanum lycopersicum TaxID=4081 RepID=A0A3Q7HQD4_SOLLC